MFLFIASEAMLFGAFFTAYFFIRVVNPEAQSWPLEPFHLPVFVAGVNTAVLLTSSFTMHWALQSIKRGNRAGMKAGLVLTLLMGLAFLLTQMLEYARIGFNPSDGAFGTIFFGLTGLHGAHVFVGLTLLGMATIRAFRAQMLEYARIGFNPSDGAFGTIFFGLTGLHGAHVFVGLTLLGMATIRAF